MDKEELKQEALLRLGLLKKQGLDEGLDCISRDFEKSERVYYSETMNKMFRGILYWLDNKPEFMALKDKFEKETGGLVYHAELSHTTIGDMLTFFYVSQHKDEWEMDREDIKHGQTFAYVNNLATPEFSEFGSVPFTCVNGGLMRTDISGRETLHKHKNIDDDLVR